MKRLLLTIFASFILCYALSAQTYRQQYLYDSLGNRTLRVRQTITTGREVSMDTVADTATLTRARIDEDSNANPLGLSGYIDPTPSQHGPLIKSREEKEAYMKRMIAEVQGQKPLQTNDPLQRFSDSYSVGAIPLEYGVSPFGARTYSVPIATAPDIKYAPSLALTYNSQSGYGYGGYGWTISGLSEIRLVAKTVYYDGDNVAPSAIDTSAVFALDGVRLVKNEDSATASDFPLVTAQGHILARANKNYLDFVQSFTVKTPDGVTSTYGLGIVNPTSNFPSYPIQNSTNLDGDRIEYEYSLRDSNEGIYIPTQIKYGFDQQNTAHGIIQFGTISSLVYNYYAGKKTRRLPKLTRITSSSDGICLYTYDLTYSTAQGNNLLHLISLTNKDGKKLPPLSFTYGLNANPHVGQDSLLINGIIRLPEDLLPGPMTEIYHRGKFVKGSYNDGLIGVIYAPIYTQTGDHSFACDYPDDYPIVFTPSISDRDTTDCILAETGFQAIEAVDVDGDGIDEVVKVNCSSTTSIGSVYSIKVYKCNDYGTLSLFQTYSVCLAGSIHYGTQHSPYLRTYRWGDFCGNGKVQLLIISYDENGYYHGQTPYYSLIDLSNGTLLYQDIVAYVGPSEDKLLVCLDIDSDTKTELCVATSGDLAMYKYTAANGFVLSKTFTSIPSSFLSSDNVYFTDINADGYIDFIKAPSSVTSSTWACKLNTGLDFVNKDFTICTKSNNEAVLFIDINRDGYPDLIKTGTDDFYYALNVDGSSFNSLESANSYLNAPASILPGNVIQHTAMSSFITIQRGGYCIQYDFTTSAPEMRQLVQSEDSFGKLLRNTYGYLPLSSLLWTENPTGIDATQGFQLRVLPIYILKAAKGFMSSANDAQVFLQDTYAWYDGVINTRGLGFCGFSKTVRSSSLESVYRTHVNRFNPQKLGIPVSSSSHPLGEQYPPYSLTTFTFDNHSTTYGKLSPRLTQTVDNDNITGIISTKSYTYDSFDFPILIITAKKIGANGYPKLIREARTFSHSNNANLYTLGIVSSYETKTERDGNLGTFMGERSEYTYNSAFHPLTRQDYFVVNSTASLVKSSRWTYDSHGNVLTDESAPYDATQYVGNSYTYDSEGRHVLTSTNALGHTTTYSTFDVYGNPSRIIDFRNRINLRSYDSWGNLTKTTYAEGTTDSTATAWGGSSIYMTTHMVSGAPTTVAHYDALSREIVTGNQRFDGQWQYIKKDYDGLGRLIRTSMPYRGSSPSYYTTYQYDGYHRLTRIVEASGRLTIRSYSGTSVTETKDGIALTRTANALGDIVSVTDAAGTITYTLRDDGQPSSITAPGGIITTFTYDAYGRRTCLTDPSAGIRNTAYSWNSDGSSVTTESNDIGNIATHVDKYGRITDVIRTGTGAFNTVYDYNVSGLLTSVVSTNSTREDYSYDQYDRVLTYKDSAPDGKYLLTVYSYGEGGRVSSIQYLSQSGLITTENFTYYYGHNTAITLNDGTTVLSITGENDFGQPTAALSGSVNRSYTYNAYGYPTSRKLTYGSTVLQHLQTTFDSSTGNLSSRMNKNYGPPYLGETFVYDDLGRLTRDRNGVIAYDTKGNVTSKWGAGTMEYNNSTHPYQIEALNAANASVTRPQAQSITYTSFDRPATILEGGPVTSFTYDGHYNRKKMQLNQLSTVLLKKYYLGDRYEREETSSSTTERLFVGGNAYTAPIVLQRIGNGPWAAYVIGRDYQGSITHIIRTAGALVAEYSYDAWGRMRDPSSLVNYSITSEPNLLLGRGYCGHEHLPLFGLINMNARLYDPVLGRFISPDPYIQAPDFSQNFNRYAYALNNPLKYTDPKGEFVISTMLLIASISAVIYSIGNVAAHVIRGEDMSNLNWIGPFMTGFFTGFALGALGYAGVSGMIALAEMPGFLGGVGEMMLMGTAGSATINTFATATSMIGGSLHHGWEGLVNAGKIFLGNFYLDENKLFWSQVGEGILRHTWAATQQSVGYFWSSFRNANGDVDRVDYLGGATFVTNENYREGSVSLGSYMNMNYEDTITEPFETFVRHTPVYMHEYGHYLDSQAFGPLYLPTIGLLSLISASRDIYIKSPEKFKIDAHCYYWTETRANRNASDYFGKYYGVSWNRDKYIDKGKERTIIDGFPF